MNHFPPRFVPDTAEAPTMTRVMPPYAERVRNAGATPLSRDTFSPRSDRLPLGRQLELAATTRRRT